MEYLRSLIWTADGVMRGDESYAAAAFTEALPDGNQGDPVFASMDNAHHYLETIMMQDMKNEESETADGAVSSTECKH